MGAFALLQLIAAFALCALPQAALAHHAGAAESAWAADPWLAALLGASALLYARGVLLLWRRAGRGRGIRAANIACFATGWTALAIALVSPLDRLAAGSFALHMIQHELLMAVSAPFFVLARPLEAWSWAIAPRALHALASVGRGPWLRAAWRTLTEPVGAWCFHAAALWIWHVPALFDAALATEPLHVLQHASFFGSALAFWWSVFGRDARSANAIAMASLLTTMLHTGALGALLTFAPTAWYSVGDAAVLGLGAVEDQQLGGLVMGGPGGLAYLAAALVIALRWLRAAPPPSRTADSPARS